MAVAILDRPKSYNDLYFRIIISLFAAHLIVTFGAKESVWLLLISWIYYRAVLLSFLIAFLLISEVYLVTVKLDKHYDWKVYLAERIGLQTVFGLIMPSFSAFLLAALYFSIYKINILNTAYLRFDFPVIVIMILMLNLYYLAFYFFRQWQFTESRILKVSSTDTEEAPKNKAVFMVQKGAKNIPLAVDAISYFYHDGDYNFVRTFEREDFLINQPLDEVQQQLHPKQFFRVNRQMLVNFTACQHFEPSSFGKLQLIVTPANKAPVIISQKRAKLFKEWIAR